MPFPHHCPQSEPADEREHFVQCHCGTWLDCRDLAAILDHDKTCPGPRDEDAGKPSPTAN